MQSMGVMDLSTSMVNAELLCGWPSSGSDHSPEHRRASLHLLQERGRGTPEQPHAQSISLCTSSEVVLGGKKPAPSPVRLSSPQEPALSTVVLGDETDSDRWDLDSLEETAGSGTACSCSNHCGSARWWGQSWLAPSVLPCHLLPGAEMDKSYPTTPHN